MKSLAMLNFNRLSRSALPPDLCSKIDSKLYLLSKNVLYLTYQVDKILKILQEESTDKGLQKQVDEFYEMDAGNGIKDQK